ncbi:zf-HC2 domain-containing protein [Marinomonas colpomeniae]|uniref:Zf-HC2 domain-containing protein n=1 Tax=Marinomonas colpomeniae TaxID=2774408 RepID=A0ABR8NXK4_9GAMM|nr:zf-HC2 domain-containing protein [Marinomonas colpomeniae]MBD5770766.1 zf-HC2 domain-containing protein [Marinomonas colpomeniae]
MMNCKEATQLLSEKLDRPLGTKEKVALGFHTTICVSCRNFAHQMEELRDISKHYMKGDTDKEK